MNKIHHVVSRIITVFFGIFPFQTFSQEGSVFVTHYFPQNEAYTSNLGILYEPNGQVILANERGILIFDGYQWELLPTPDIPTVLLALPKQDRIAVGGRNMLGWIERKNNGEYVFMPLRHDSAGIVMQIEATDSFVYFLTPRQLIIGTHDLGRLHTIAARKGSSFQLLLPIAGKMYVDDGSSRLWLITEKGLQPSVSFSLAGKVIFARRYDKNSLFLVTTTNQCFRFDGSNVIPFPLEDQAYLNQGTVTQVVVTGSYIAFATNHGGCLVVNKKNGTTLHYINYQTGLPDDEIYCMTDDPDGGIWLGHYYGLSRADLNLPVKNFSTYPGLQGRPQCMAVVQNSLYVGTNEGVFHLVKKASYQAVVKPPVPKAPVSVATESRPVVELPQPTETPVVAEEPVKKGLFARIFGKKKKKDDVKADEEAKKPDEMGKILSPTGERKPSGSKISYRLASVSYQYEKIQGINKKCKQLILFNNGLLAIASDEILRLQNGKFVSVVKNTTVNATYVDHTRQVIYLATTQGIKKMNASFRINDLIPGINEPVLSLTLTENILWAGLEKKILKIQLSQPEVNYKTIPLVGKADRFILKNIQQTPFVFTSNDVYRIVHDSLQHCEGLSGQLKNASKFLTQPSDKLWVNAGNTWRAIAPTDSTKIETCEWLNLFDNISYIARTDTLLWIIENSQNLYRVSLPQLTGSPSTFRVFIKKLIGNSGQLFPLDRIELSPSENFLKLVVFAPGYIKSNTMQYAFYIENLMQQWSNWGPSPEFNMTLPPGRWKIHVKAKNLFGQESEEKIIQIVIHKPFYQQWWFYMLIGAMVVLLAGAIVSLRIRYLEHEKAVLEAKVKERTREIEEQKEEILSQRDALAMQNILITEQKSKIEHINKEITDSIRYAQHIQSSLLPNKAELDKVLPQYFVLYKPKDIVAGDFYWARRKDNKIFVAVADCTGHGVPGGFLTMLGISFLNEIFLNNRDWSPHEVLNQLRDKMISSLLRENQEQQAQDGMDIAFCIIDNDGKKIHFAAANSQAYLIRGQQVLELKGDKMPIGLHVNANKSFTSSEIDFSAGDELFLFSDGYKDQIGGEDEKRLKSGAFKKILVDIYPQPVEIQQHLLEKTLADWKGPYDQTDDILVMGIKF